MKRCDYCGAEIYFDKNVKSESGKLIPIEVKTREKHDCVSKPNHPAHGKYFEDNDNAEISKMMDIQVKKEVVGKALKPSHESELALQQRISELKRDLYSKDEEFQDYRRKTDAKIKELEDRIQKLEARSGGNPTDGPE